jgi:SAM-dependent methyltransferase
MINNIIEYLERPEIYKQSDVNFWNDKHVSKQMLQAHLDPLYEGASRNIDFIESSVKWIQETIPSSTHHKLLDIGCGPGIYAERFAMAGYQVTGIDFSERSIEYAQNSAKKHGLEIMYKYQDYLKLDINSIFDFATLIYCDYGALSTLNRQVIMQNIYRALKPGGKFLLDVFSMVKYDIFQEAQTWDICPGGGFWNAEKYLVLNGSYKYQDNATLEQVVVITDVIRTYYIWTCYFSKENLSKEAQEAGFKMVGIFSDVAGNPYTKDSPTIAILLEK